MPLLENDHTGAHLCSGPPENRRIDPLGGRFAAPDHRNGREVKIRGHSITNRWIQAQAALRAA